MSFVPSMAIHIHSKDLYFFVFNIGHFCRYSGIKVVLLQCNFSIFSVNYIYLSLSPGGCSPGHDDEPAAQLLPDAPGPVLGWPTADPESA